MGQQENLEEIPSVIGNKSSETLLIRSPSNIYWLKIF